MEKKEYTSPYDFEGKIPLKQAIILGLQHVLAMFVGNLTPVLIITGACAAMHDADVLVGKSQLSWEQVQDLLVFSKVLLM